MKNQAKSICTAIKDILNSTNLNINTIIFVGGYCSNEIMISLIKKELDQRIKNYLQPSKPCLAIMEGAVLFGINPNIINTRISRYTIGQGTRGFWNEKICLHNFDYFIRCLLRFDGFLSIQQRII